MLSKKEDKIIHKRKRINKLSAGELAISNFLFINGINFYSEFFFKEMKQNKKFKLLFFDFYIPDYNLCIEFDGEQHYTGKYKGKKLINQAKNDFLKNAFCKSKSIHLLRIKYNDIKNIDSIITKKFDEIAPI